MAQQQAMKNDAWITPKPIIDALGPFDLDPCYDRDMPWKTAQHKFTVNECGLTSHWHRDDIVWLNPPYGRGIDRWLEKMCDHDHGIALLPANTDAAWFHDYVWKADALLWRSGRISFCDTTGKPISGNTKGSVFAAWGWDMVGRLEKHIDTPAVGNGGKFMVLT
jgi:phage N-6-adenine-methyltransferase